MIEIKYATLYILTYKYSVKVNKVKRHAMASMFFKSERLYRPTCNLSSASAFVFILNCPYFLLLFSINRLFRLFFIWKLLLWLWYLPLSKDQISLEKKWKLQKKRKKMTPFRSGTPNPDLTRPGDFGVSLGASLVSTPSFQTKFKMTCGGEQLKNVR